MNVFLFLSLPLLFVSLTDGFVFVYITVNMFKLIGNTVFLFFIFNPEIGSLFCGLWGLIALLAALKSCRGLIMDVARLMLFRDSSAYFFSIMMLWFAATEKSFILRNLIIWRVLSFSVSAWLWNIFNSWWFSLSELLRDSLSPSSSMLFLRTFIFSSRAKSLSSLSLRLWTGSDYS